MLSWTHPRGCLACFHGHSLTHRLWGDTVVNVQQIPEFGLQPKKMEKDFSVLASNLKECRGDFPPGRRVSRLTNFIERVHYPLRDMYPLFCGAELLNS